ATDAKLELTVRSTRGAQHTIVLPQDAQVQSVAIDGHDQPIRQDGRSLTLPVAPGRQRFAVSWRTPQGIGALFRAPDVDLNAPAVSARTTIAMPGSRWTLLVGGPGMGPAVLFWTLLIVSLIVSAGLGAIRETPLRRRHWFLLSLGLTQVPIWVSLLIAA